MHTRTSTHMAICLYTNYIKPGLTARKYVIGYVHAWWLVQQLCRKTRHNSLQFPSTSCPGRSGFISWTAVSSVFICRVKLLPLAVTMVIVPPGSVACRGARRTSLDSTLWEWSFERKLGAQQPCKCIHGIPECSPLHLIGCVYTHDC